MATKRAVALKQKLSALSEKELRLLLNEALVEAPGLFAWLEQRFSKSPPSANRKRGTQELDERAILGQITRALAHVNPHDWKRSASGPDLLQPFFDQAKALHENNRSDQALRILGSMCSVTVPKYEEYEGEAELAGFLEETAELMAVVIADVVMSQTDHDALEKQLNQWNEHLGGYGGEDTFTPALTALAKQTPTPFLHP